MAAGASWNIPNHAVSVLHAARGLTNAAGAIGCANRNEIGGVHIVGLPSTHSVRFLPPHGEPNLLSAMGHFSRSYFELPGPPNVDDAEFVNKSASAFRCAEENPKGPVLLGLPQDVSELRWISEKAIQEGLKFESCGPRRKTQSFQLAEKMLAVAENILIIVDDFALRLEDFELVLAEFAQRADAQVLQVKYQRGPMLFQRISLDRVPSFIGYLDTREQRSILNKCDLLITIEDRNMYPRVVGSLPECRKIAITSNARMTRKNEYLNEHDVLIEGSVVEVLASLSNRLPQDRQVSHISPVQLKKSGSSRQAAVVGCLGDFLGTVRSPTVIDDSQMFGGLVREHYDLLPRGVQVIGDHSGFVGGGIAFSCGFSLANPGRSVICLLGDQAFVNGIQGLISCKEENVRIVFIVCDNGRSVSLAKQLDSLEQPAGRHTYLENPTSFSCVDAAEGLGIRTWSVHYTQTTEFTRALYAAFQAKGPTLVHLKIDAGSDFWSGIWETSGLDE